MAAHDPGATGSGMSSKAHPLTQYDSSSSSSYRAVNGPVHSSDSDALSFSGVACSAVISVRPFVESGRASTYPA
jgi:hypothetical protein